MHHGKLQIPAKSVVGARKLEKYIPKFYKIIRNFLRLNMANRSLTKMGLLRILGFLEGLSLLILIFVAVPMKYLYGNHHLSKTLGPVHGALFLLFLFVALRLAGLKKNAD